MHDASDLVEVLQGPGDLDDDVPRQVLAEVGEPDDLVEQLAARCQLEDDVVVLFRFGKVDEVDDVGVFQLAHDLNLLQNIRSLWPVSARSWNMKRGVLASFSFGDDDCRRSATHS